MKKILILVHRYVGIGICLLMAAWCLSGIVMMYVAFPGLEEHERVAGLPAIDLRDCCAFDEALASVGDVSLNAYAVEMLAGRPVLKVEDDFGTVLVDLKTGQPLTDVSQEDAQRVASDYMQARGIAGSPAFLDSLETNQWTVTGAYDDYRPMFRFALGDPARTELYVASTNGEVVLDTTGKERFWNWFGAVTHWLYPSMLRQHAVAWAQVVIWTSIIGTFLTLTGLWLGIMQIRAGRNRKFSPYSGWNWWHHVSGLVFGILTLTWVVSGLVSMSPWGWLEGTSSRPERQRLRNLEITSVEAIASLQKLVAAQTDNGAVRIASAPFAGHLYLTAQSAAQRTRLDAMSLEAVTLQEVELRQAAEQLQPGVPIASAGLMASGDAYYYDDHNGSRSYPVYRVVLANAESTRYYLDPANGALLQKTDRDGRWYRWLFEAFHRWDFSQGLRQRPLWDLVVLPLIFGVTALSITGVYLGFRRVTPKKRSGV